MDMADLHTTNSSSVFYGANLPQKIFDIVVNDSKDVLALQNYECWRIMANGQVKGQNGNWHQDHGELTVLYFPLEWLPEWGGSTLFKVYALDKEIKYLKNRLVVFDSSMFHYGSCPNIENVLRISIAFNLRATNS
jgi:hypothetical protein